MKKIRLQKRLGKWAYILGTALVIASIVTHFLPPGTAYAVSPDAPEEVSIVKGSHSITNLFGGQACAGSKVVVCHATGSAQNPYSSVDVCVKSVEDAADLGGHGKHEADVWPPFEFGGVWYSGQNIYNVNLDGQCNIILPAASASAAVGTCAWDAVRGSLTPVNVSISNAVVHTGAVAGDITTSQTISVGPGSYSWSWEAVAGYSGSGTLDFSAGTCAPDAGSASAVVGACAWDAETGSQISVDVSISNAVVHTGAVAGDIVTSQTLSVDPGSYSWPWEAAAGFTGSGVIAFTADGCVPPDASASAATGSCTWDATNGSITPVTLTISGAVVHTDTPAGDITSSQTLNVTPGSYAWDWEAVPGYKGSGTLTFTAGECVPLDAFASVTPGACTWDEVNGSQTSITLSITGAIVDTGEVAGFINSSTVLNVAPGSYSWPWAAAPGYKGSGLITFTAGECIPGEASASAYPGACAWDEENGSVTAVTVTIDNAVVHTEPVAGDVTTSQTINVGPGSYSWPWEAVTGYVGSGALIFTAGECIPPDATAEATLGTCEWSLENGSRTPVDLVITGAVVSTGAVAGDVAASQTLYVDPGNYSWPWVAATGYKGSGALEFSAGECQPLPLQLAAACDADPVNYNMWIVTNPNAIDLPFEYSGSGGINGTGIAAANSSGYFHTARGSSSDDMSLYSGGVYQAYVKAAGGCIPDNPEPPQPPPPPQVQVAPLIIPVTGAPTVLIPVTGVDKELIRRVMPGSLMSLGLGFIGVGFIFSGISRRKN